jgi:hypothetical protein
VNLHDAASEDRAAGRRDAASERQDKEREGVFHRKILERNGWEWNKNPARAQSTARRPKKSVLSTSATVV